MALIGRLAIAWATVAMFLFFGGSWLADLSSVLRAAGLFVWLFAVALRRITGEKPTPR
jgi:Ca2+:H+ antiporter